MTLQSRCRDDKAMMAVLGVQSPRAWAACRGAGKARSGVSGLCGWQLRSRPSGPKRGVLCFHALGDNVFADSLNSRFIHSTCAAHRVEI
jgi:hypothetical protein